MADLQTFLTEQNQTMERLFPPAALAAWDHAITGSDEAAKASEEGQRRILEQFSQTSPFERIRGFLADPPADRLQHRQLAELKNEYLSSQFPAETVAEIARLGVELDTCFTTYRGTIDDKPVSDNEAVSILQSSDDPALRKKAWEATKMVAGEVAPKLRQ
ncbi:MAG TPA: M2 family metallopeptidase, partial [bacterium]|nr:M2 family metallopeptidase [bacterium]